MKFFVPKNESQKALVSLVQNNHAYIFALGPAGTGKSHACVAIGASLIKEKWAHKLIICRPNVSAGKSSGLLPGTLEEKLGPLLVPITEILGKLGTPGEIPGWVHVCSFEYMRGRTFDDAVVIVDEAQNATLEELEMVLTRLGSNSLMMLAGDPAQSDLGIPSLPLLMKLLDKEEDFPVVYFTEKDNMRHPLVQKLVRIFAKYRSRSQDTNES
jgi:phosphate starvation-inducible PhoH-like protein